MTLPPIVSLGPRPSTEVLVEPVGPVESLAPRAASPGYSAARAGLAGALLGYLLVVVLTITLAPFDFHAPDPARWTLSEWTVLDLTANVLLFLPLGFLLRQGGDPVVARRDRLALRAVVLGLVLSASIEAMQLGLPDRYASPWDVLTNVAGAWLGALAYDRVHVRLDPAAVLGRLGLELPLMGLVYLLVPLGWLSAVAAPGEPARWWLLLCLGLFGASVLGAVQRRHFAPAGASSARGMAVAGGIGMVVAALPALNARPLFVAGLAAVVALFTWHRAAMAEGPGAERRFELATLVRAAPFFATYLLLLPLVPPAADPMLQRTTILAVVEVVAAFTVLGFMTAEAWGRRELPFRQTVPVVTGIAAVAAAVVASLRAGGPPTEAQMPETVAALLAALYGGWLYHLQRERVRELLHGRRLARRA
ncbi:MAG TPA: VanZ family protein [Gemmatimonadaceae bacterium]|nr:VanZ family protein [Gemmatimonadaceae bacterium]